MFAGQCYQNLRIVWLLDKKHITITNIFLFFVYKSVYIAQLYCMKPMVCSAVLYNPQGTAIVVASVKDTGNKILRFLYL